MKELYEMIEKLVRESGYPGPIDGREFYHDVSDEADTKDNGTYMFAIKKTDTLIYQGCMDILDNAFDLHYVNIHDGDQVYHVNFDV